MPDEITENSNLLKFNEEEALNFYNKLYLILNLNGVPHSKLACYILIYIRVEELRNMGIPMQSIVEAIAGVEQFKEKLN